MPFKRYARKPYKKTYKKTYSKSTLSNSALSSKVRKISKQVKIASPIKLSNVQKPTTLDITTTAQSIIPISASTVNNDPRYFNSLTWKGLLKQVVPSTSVEHTRFVLVKDNRKFDNDVAPVWTDLFDTENVYSLRAGTENEDAGIQKRSFSVLFDKTFTTTYDADSTLNNSKMIQLHKSFKTPLKMYNKTKYQQNQLYIMYLSTMTTGGIDFEYCQRTISQYPDHS